MGFWAAAAPYIATAIGSGLSMLNKPEEARTGYDVVTMPQYDWSEGALGATNSYLMDIMESVRKGQEPAWMQNYLQPMRQSAHQDLYNRFYGSGGRPGILQDIVGMNSGFGVGPRAASAKGYQGFTDFMSEADKIDQYFNQMRYGAMQNYSTQIPAMIAGMPRGPESQLAVYGGSAGAPSGGNPMASMMGQLAQNVPWENVFGGGTFNSGNVTSQYSNLYPSTTYGAGTMNSTYKPTAINYNRNMSGQTVGNSGVAGFEDDYSQYPVAY